MYTAEIAQTSKAINPDIPCQTRALFTVRQFSEKYPAFSESSLRNLIFLAGERYTSKGDIPGNGLHKALVRIGRKLLIDEVKFLDWLDKQQMAGDA